MRNVFSKAAIVVMLAGAVSACTVVQGRQDASSYASDTAISTKVRANIVNDPNVSLGQVDVETMNGVVQLSGFVDSGDKKARAADIAKSVEGVRSVKNDIVVR